MNIQAMYTNRIKDVIVFGTNDFGQLAHYYITNDSSYDVKAFTTHDSYIEAKSFLGLKVCAFEEIINIYPPDKYLLFVPMSGRKMNQYRERVYLEGKDLGYSFLSYVSSKTSIFNTKVGENCFILEDNTIQPFVEIGNNVTMWSGNHIGHHSTIKDHVFFTSQVTLSGHCDVSSHCWFGVNATIIDQCKLAKGTLIGMGANLGLKETDEWGIYVGNPAQRKGKIPSYKIN